MSKKKESPKTDNKDFAKELQEAIESWKYEPNNPVNISILAKLGEIDNLTTIPDISDEIRENIASSFFHARELVEFLGRHYGVVVAEIPDSDMWRLRADGNNMWEMQTNARATYILRFLLENLRKEVVNLLSSSKTCSSGLF